MVSTKVDEQFGDQLWYIGEVVSRLLDMAGKGRKGISFIRHDMCEGAGDLRSLTFHFLEIHTYSVHCWHATRCKLNNSIWGYSCSLMVAKH